MNARSAVFALISIRSQPLRKLVKRLPYAPPTVYKAVQQLEAENRVQVKGGVVMLVEDYPTQKLSDIYVQSLSHGIDPERLTRDSTLSVWKSLASVSTIKEIMEETGLSAVSVKKILSFLKEKELVSYKKRKPILAEQNPKHPLFLLLKAHLGLEEDGTSIRYPGHIPFMEILNTPDQVEKLLYEQIDKSLAVKDTGFVVKGESSHLTILESVEKELSNEEIFLRKMFTPEGLEDVCILMIKQGLIDYDELLLLAKEKGLVNPVGCYLDILHGIEEKMVSLSIIKKFLEERTKKKVTLLAQDKKYGKSGWETTYEEQWNVDLYLDIEAVEHGVRGL
ncbi:MAG: hypothetical protein QCI38_08525 [Candidatus Thermoplasmatota archaeon]|nr:hypothetical protein [Candidatus Thermoplasmatota archaeon]